MLYGCISSTLEEKPILTGIKLLPADKTKTQPISPHPFSESCSHMTKSHDFSVTWQKSYGKPLVLTPEWFSVADPGISRFTRSHPKDRPFIYYSRLLRHVRVPRSHCVLTRIPWGSHHLSYTATRESVLRMRPQKPRRRVTTGLAKSFSLKSAWCRAMTCTSSNLRWLSYMSG